MEFRILGSTEVLDGTRRLDLPRGRARSLLALLVLQAGEPVSAERLIDELWGEQPPPTAATVIHGAIARLRRVLEPDRKKRETSSIIETTATGYRLAIDPDTVDANRFKRLLDEARASPPEIAATQLSEALRLWRGPPLADFAYEPFAQRAISALEELRLETIEDRADAELARGGGVDLVPELERLTREHPFRERLYGLLMLALYRAGRQTEALETYHRARTVLVEEMGIEPGPALRDLETAILRQDPSLGLRDEGRPEREAGSWLPRERRPVAVIVADVAPLTGADADAEAVARLGEHATRLAAEVLERHGARVERGLGDVVTAFFGFPVAHEDDTLRAVRAGVELRTSIDALTEEQTLDSQTRHRCRIGIETGDIVVDGPAAGPRVVVAGTVVGRAARLQQAATDGDVLVGPSAQRLTRGAVIVETIRVDGPPEGWRVLDVLSGATGVAREFDAPMVGRQADLTRLRSAFRRAVRSGRPVRTTVLGEAGIGKSRLARELVASIGADAHAMIEQCPAYGEATFFPLRAAFNEAAGFHTWQGLHAIIADDEGRTPREIADGINLRAEPGSADTLFPAMRRLLEILSAEHPLIVVFEDLHWAGTTFLDLVDYLEREAVGPMFLLGLARSDVLERRPEWGDGDVVVLEPLSADDVAGLVVERAGAIGRQPLEKIIETSRGNPLFAEQLIAAQGEEPVDAVPASLQGLLTMRLDRLGPGERDLLRCASIVGSDAGADAVTALLPEEARPFVGRHLEALERKRLIARTGATSLQFAHVLIQLTAYHSMTREDRARLHERYADHLELTSQDPELDEIIGYHLEQAVLHRRASGVVEADDSALARRASERLVNAADRARARPDAAAAERLLARSRTLLADRRTDYSR